MADGVIGTRLPKRDAPDKVAGRAIYGHDLVRPGMLEAAILRSPHAHARIMAIDVEKARALPGVYAVLTGRDLPDHTFGLAGDGRVLQVERVRRVGDEVAAIAAVDAATAAAALDLVKVRYEPLPAVFEPAAALELGAPLVHPGRKSNLYDRLEYVHGDPDAALQAADVVVENRFDLPHVAPMPLEPSFCLAEFNADGTLTIFSTTQAPYLMRHNLARALNLDAGRIRVVQTAIGGAFGRGLDLYPYEPIAVLLAQASGRPVRVAYDRQEEFLAAPVRQPVQASGRAGARRDGTLLVRDVHLTLDIGAYASLGTVTPKVMAQTMASLYRVPHVRFDVDLVYTNNPLTGAMRGFGGPQATFVVEVLMDQLAEALDRDPVAFRIQNANRPNETTPQGLRITSCGLQECLEAVRERLAVPEGDEEGPSRRGVGFAAMLNVGGGARMYRSDACGAIVQVDDYGQVTLITGASEIGQGGDTALAQIVAAGVGVPVEAVRVINGDTAVAPWDVGVHASRTTFVAGNAALQAAREARAQIVETAAELLEVATFDLETEGGYVFMRGFPDRRLSLGKVVRARHFRADGENVLGRGWYEPESEFVGEDMRGNLSATYSFAAQGIEVEVDDDTGAFRVNRIVVAVDAGRAINPMLVEGQLEGGICMGLGYALSEQLFLEYGRVENDSLREYGMLTALDMPPVEIVLIETDDGQGPFGAKGVGEVGVAPVAAAVSNALFAATGVRLSRLPLLPERLFLHLHKREQTNEIKETNL